MDPKSTKRSGNKTLGDAEAFQDENGNFEDEHFQLNHKGYIVFNENLVIDNRYRLQSSIVLDEQGTTAKGRYGSVFRVLDLQDGVVKALKINRIPPEEEDAKRQAAKDYLKQQQAHSKSNGNYEESPKKVTPQYKTKRRVKTVKERYKSSCKREIGVLKRVTRKNQGELIPCLVLYDYGQYLGHTYMIFPIYDMPLQQHLANCQKYQDLVHKKQSLNENPNPPNTAPNNALIHPEDLWAFEEQLISALSYIHNVCHVMHLDFKPKNIMINQYGYDIQKYAKNLHLIKLRKNAITLIDFSVSAKAPKKANLDEVRYTGNFGTRRYRPPEMIYGGKWNRSVDTYGTGMIILECVKLYPVIDTTYYKRKKIVKFKKKIKNAQLTTANIQHHDRLYREQDQLNGTTKDKETTKRLSPPPPPKLNSGYKQLDISEVLYLIMQQIGFPQKAYWQNLSASERGLFPRHPLIENVRRKGRRAKLFDEAQDTNIPEEKINGAVKSKEDTDSESEDDDAFMPWNSFSPQLVNHRGVAWNLLKHYGSALIESMKLELLEESIKRMMVWDPLLRITPEQCLKEYFPKSETHFDLDLNDDDEDF